jgi:hypothetical protein
MAQMNGWHKAVAVALVAYFTIAALGRCTPKDDTDPHDRRSGMRLYRDAMTGCEYLSPGVFGGLTPRLDQHGRHVCRTRTGATHD